MKKNYLPLRSWLTIIFFVLISVLGNVYHLSLFFGIDFLFGSIAVLIILQCYGILWGGISALIASSYTYWLWGHPYGVLVLTGEALWLGWFLKRYYPHNLVWYDALYWGLVGIPLLWLILYGILEIDSKIVWLIALKQTINGIFNALWASLIVAYTPIGRELIHETQHTVPFRQTIYNVLAASVLSIALSVMIFNTRLAVQEVELNATFRLEEESSLIRQTINEWVDINGKIISALAQQITPTHSINELQSTMDVVRNTARDFLWIYTTDATATVIAASPSIDIQGRSWLGLNAATYLPRRKLPDQQRFVVSEVLSTGINSTEPLLTLTAPIIHNQKVIGYLQGALDTAILCHWLEQKWQLIGLQITVLDSKQRVIVSSEPTYRGSHVAYHASHVNEPLTEGSDIAFWVPESAKSQPVLTRWQQAFLSHRTLVGESLNWQLIVKIPLAHYQRNLYALHLKNLAMMLGIILLIVWLASKISQRMVTSLERLSIISANLTNCFYNPQDVMWPQSAITEVNILIANFSKMAHHLQNQFDAVEERSFKLAEITLQLQEKILERQETEVILKRAKEAAEVANRAKSTFLANMSHELRTPLNGILGYTQILNLDKNLTEEQREGVDIIQRSGEHLLTLINDILDLSKIEAGRLELSTADFRFFTFLKDIADLFRMRAQQKGILFEFVGQEDDLPLAVHADEKRLRQILLNLLGNAVKFTQKGQVIFSVHSELIADTGQRKICFEVEDSGQGIADNHLDSIFLPFQQVGDPKQQIEGTGLGLPISRRLVELMGGNIQVESTLGIGSKFWFEINLPEVSGFEDISYIKQPRIISYHCPEDLVQPPFKILVVDDLMENRTVLMNLLAPLGFNLAEACNGAEALTRARDYLPHLVIMDLKMPVMDGLECTRQLRQDTLFQKTVIITVTASAFEYHQQESLKAGCDAFLTKPVVASKLFQLMQEYCNLTWVYEETTSVEQLFSTTQTESVNKVIVPPANVMTALYKLAQAGDIQGIDREIDRLANLESGWHPFLKEVHQLAKNFKIKKLKELLKQHVG